MEILEILKNSKDDIYLEDLEFFETELATGDYSESYAIECRKQISVIKKWICGDEAVEVKSTKKKKSPIMQIQDITPNQMKPAADCMTIKEIIFADIKSIRDSDGYKTKFKQYVQGKKEIDACFVDANFSFFLAWEVDAIVSVKQVDEEFLEKYFTTLDKEKIARYQKFSEGFFMRHYSELDTQLVLTKGKNASKKKEKRSQQLDIFLRLKGVRL